VSNAVYRPTTNGLAIASLVFGILWIYWVGTVLALVFGYRALKQIAESDGRERGREFAHAGIVLGFVGLAAGAAVAVAIAGYSDMAWIAALATLFVLLAMHLEHFGTRKQPA
jgi:hypothetical protein